VENEPYIIKVIGGVRYAIISGVVKSVLPASWFQIELDGSKKLVRGKISGKIRRYRIRIELGDKVQVRLSLSDLQNSAGRDNIIGIITRRGNIKLDDAAS